ncbi:ATP-dependent DNA helicase RecG [Carboxydothermus islandicus]|uniref:ATP-dependent DNA helicase RecG n=2 Tax=Carboxydothermus islandicus TaxID=661089 RepID=A0A1L8D1N8_9THEO|nr:ATP-dependent DNA helicase RecG [Carboxydothermus islandicus]
MDIPVQYLKGVGPQKAKLLQKLKIETVKDLIYYFPKRYEDRSSLKKINELINDEVTTVLGTIVEVKEVIPRDKLKILKVGINDGSGIAYGCFFNQSYLKNVFVKGKKVYFYGKVEKRFFETNIYVYEYEFWDKELLHTNRLVPIYPLTENLSPKTFRQLIKNALDKYLTEITEPLPEEILRKYSLPDLKQALMNLHFPESSEQSEIARRRMVFEEFLLFFLAIGLYKENYQKKPGIVIAGSGELEKKFIDSLPFKLTSAQEKVWREIKEDLAAKKPMNRLVQGDVGSGKTILAALALVKAVEAGFQGALMAPTEILAEQHYLNLNHLFAPLGIKVVLLSGSLSPGKKEAVYAAIKNGYADVIIGTHALIQEAVIFYNLGLAVIDEQHRFGVEQRSSLVDKGLYVNQLVMSATPIPRTLALTLYGDLDISIVDALPAGRKPIKTYWLSSQDKGKAYAFLLKQVAEGRQGYVVCPLVEESEKLQVEAVTKLYEKLSKKFPQFKWGLMHGRLKPAKKEEVMENFRKNKIQILVSTTVIEVGVDVPNANVIIIEDAWRFGLAQLHQIRGRVGRGEHQSYCFLLGNPKNQEGIFRMKIMEKYNDGFKIAEEDLKLRGPGELSGTRQSGAWEFKLADIVRDQALLFLAKKEADEILTNKENHRALITLALEKYGDKINMFQKN